MHDMFHGSEGEKEGGGGGMHDMFHGSDGEKEGGGGGMHDMFHGSEGEKGEVCTICSMVLRVRRGRGEGMHNRLWLCDT